MSAYRIAGRPQALDLLVAAGGAWAVGRPTERMTPQERRLALAEAAGVAPPRQWLIAAMVAPAGWFAFALRSHSVALAVVAGVACVAVGLPALLVLHGEERRRDHAIATLCAAADDLPFRHRGWCDYLVAAKPQMVVVTSVPYPPTIVEWLAALDRRIEVVPLAPTAFRVVVPRALARRVFDTALIPLHREVRIASLAMGDAPISR